MTGEGAVSESVGGILDSRGEWQPAERPTPAPLWAWPPRPLATAKWFFGFPGYLWPVNAFFMLVAILTWLYTQPELSRMAEFRLDWIAQNYVRNVALLVLFAGAIHLRLYTFRGQGTKYKFNPKWLGGKEPRFLGGTQLRDNVFWSIASSCTVWTAYAANVEKIRTAQEVRSTPQGRLPMSTPALPARPRHAGALEQLRARRGASGSPHSKSIGTLRRRRRFCRPNSPWRI